jgi:RNA polymerase sigma-70 factor, ECF subfamily
MKGDRGLVAAALAGDADAFRPIVERYQHAVFGVALARLGDFHEAQDAAQQVFVEAFQRLGGLRDPARLGAWLRSMTVHRCIDLLRRRKSAVAIEYAENEPSTDLPPDSDLVRRELRDRVMAAIGRLSKTQRETVTLFYINPATFASRFAPEEFLLTSKCGPPTLRSLCAQRAD